MDTLPQSFLNWQPRSSCDEADAKVPGAKYILKTSQCNTKPNRTERDSECLSKSRNSMKNWPSTIRKWSITITNVHLRIVNYTVRKKLLVRSTWTVRYRSLNIITNVLPFSQKTWFWTVLGDYKCTFKSTSIQFSGCLQIFLYMFGTQSSSAQTLVTSVSGLPPVTLRIYI